MNTCRDQIMSLEKQVGIVLGLRARVLAMPEVQSDDLAVWQYLYNKKQSMKLLMDDKLGKSDRKQRMTADWYQTWEDFRVEVDEQKEVLQNNFVWAVVCAESIVLGVGCETYCRAEAI